MHFEGEHYANEAVSSLSRDLLGVGCDSMAISLRLTASAS